MDSIEKVDPVSGNILQGHGVVGQKTDDTYGGVGRRSPGQAQPHKNEQNHSDQTRDGINPLADRRLAQPIESGTVEVIRQRQGGIEKGGVDDQRDPGGSLASENASLKKRTVLAVRCHRPILTPPRPALELSTSLG